MNREILFRGKRVDNGEWIEGYCCVRLNNKAYIARIKRLQNDEEVLIYVEVIPETVGQYTGLTDKNGKKIFEGDIVMHIQKYDISGVVASVGIVRWSNSYGAWVITDFDNGRADMFLGNEAHRVEVIGNIHDNPELLEVSKCIGKRS